MVPPFGNALIDMLKFTALLPLVTIQELAYRADAICSVLADAATIYSLTLLIYFAMALVSSALVQRLEVIVNRWAGRTAQVSDTAGRVERPTSGVPRWAFGR